MGILWLVVVLAGFPLILMAASGFRIGRPVDVENSLKAMMFPSLLLLVAYLHCKVKELLAVQRCEVSPDGAITLMRYNRQIPFDVKHYRYVRMYLWQWGAPGRHRIVPGMLILRRDAPLTFWTAVGTHIYPRFNDERVIVFLQTWRMADGRRISSDAMTQVFHHAAGGRIRDIRLGT